jgi:hypothetical protein
MTTSPESKARKAAGKLREAARNSRQLEELKREFSEVRQRTRNSREPLLRPTLRPTGRQSLEDIASEEAAWNFRPQGPPGTGKT